MQKVEYERREYILPEHHDGDREWLISILYGVNTKKYEAGPPLIDVQRNARIVQYEETYTRVIDNYTRASGDVAHKGPSVARRKANIELRERIELIKSIRNGDTVGINYFTIS